MKKYQFWIALIVLVTIGPAKVSAQSLKDSLTNQPDKVLAISMRISNHKAAQLRAAMEVNRYSLDTLFKNKSLKAYDRQKRLLQLLNEREIAVRKVLTQSEIARLDTVINSFADTIRAKKIKELTDKNTGELEKVPHRALTNAEAKALGHANFQ
ncbi:hypothetical protein [Mucilaginibacter psychrotolerans]|uniref:Uncharacterized protein n=1 Tax=Mucilaginibacter psychrotolerans TaxID=1524096 RepID=A0A4Y8S4G8_9SPHI|nr:hypothetical protein [Mucilaginibacter psychrotolerans]TFF33314.1 hypothetical protein E2R66_26615 [Mucilaginibacter psychrotolerans]